MESSSQIYGMLLPRASEVKTSLSRVDKLHMLEMFAHLSSKLVVCDGI